MAAEGPSLEGETEGASLCSRRGNEKEFGGNVCSEILHLRASSCLRKAWPSSDTFSGFSRGRKGPAAHLGCVSKPSSEQEASSKLGEK